MISQAVTAARVGGPRSSRDGVPSAVRCLVLIGTRNEAITLFPVVRALQDCEYIEPFVVVSGQAGGPYESVLELAGVTPQADLRCEAHGRTVNHVVAGMVSRFDDLLTRLRGGPERRHRPRLFGPGNTPSYPSATIVSGASAATLGAALAASGAGVPVVHVASDATEAAPAPGTADFNRRLISRLASFAMTPTSRGMAQLVSEGIGAERVFVTGDTRVDAFVWAAERQIDWPHRRLAELDDPERTVLLADLRHTCGGEGLRCLTEALGQVAAVRPDVITVVPVGADPSLRAALIPALSGLHNVLVLEPLPYAAFARLVARADLALSDSPSLQVEAPGVGTPVLAVGGRHRPEGVEAGCVRPVPSDPVAIADHAIELLDRTVGYEQMLGAPNPFGDGAAAARIAAAMEHLIFDTPPPAPFGVAFSRRRVLEAAGYSGTEVNAADSLTRVRATLVPLERSGA